MALYSVGDRVLVRPDIEAGEVYHMADNSDLDTATPEMAEYAGQVVTISRVSRKYHVHECGWNWTDGMFAGKAVELDAIDVSVDVGALI